jgi:HAE1 family hydrophobic/amphiphilic exporter-1
MLETLIKRRVTTSMIFLGICLIGIISLGRLPVQLLPDIEFPKLTVVTPYENAAPSEIEQLVSKYIEEAASSVNGVSSIHSESIEGLSLVTSAFEWGTDMDIALIETKEKVDIIKGQLPQDTGKSIVVKFDPRADPIMIFSIVNRSGDFRRIRMRIEKEIAPFLERIDGVAVVDITGGYRRQININLENSKIFSHNLSLSEVMDSVNMANYNFPAGSVERGSKEYLIRTIGEFNNVDEIGSVVVGRNEAGIPIYLRDIGHIEDGYKDRKCIIRSNGRESIGILIRKEPGKNTIEICSRIDERIEQLREKFKEFYIWKIYDQSRFIESSVQNVFRSAVIGGIIAIVVLWFFLKELRSPLIIASSIPISIMGTVSLMYFRGISINAMSLGGLALGVGMMVDAGIVVLEAINRKTGESATPAVEGTNEVRTAVIASTLTSIVVFLPIVFLSGLSGALFGELALTISFALLCSLISSVFLMPMLSTVSITKQLARGLLKKAGRIQGSIFSLSNRFIDHSLRLYNTIIRFSLENRRPILVGGIVLFLAGIALFLAVDTELMPRVDPGEFTIDLEAPRGTSLSESSKIALRVERYLMGKPYVRYVYSKIGSDPEDNIAEKISGRRTHNILITIILRSRRDRDIHQIVESLKREMRFGEYIKADYRIKENVVESIFSRSSKPLTVEIYGRDKERLSSLGNRLKSALSDIEGIYNLSSTLDEGDPELKINIDRNRMAALGVTISDVASTIRSAIHGMVVSKFRERDDEIDIRVRLSREDRTGKETLYRILVKTDAGATIPIVKFADINEGFGASKIIRSEQSRVNQITTDISGDKERIFKRVEEILSSTTFGEDYEARIVGERDEIKRSFLEMRFALILAIILIYMLLAAQFQSFKNPLIIMLSIPVAALGISGSLFITGKSLNINSGIGIIMLAGIVVNNAIVLFDYIERERSTGKNIAESIIAAGERRLKPILMTTATTIFALFPIALGIGEGSELQQPLAIAVIGGLAFSTFLTLVFIPTVYAMVNDE